MNFDKEAIRATVRDNVALRSLVEALPLIPQRDAIWDVLAVAYTAGILHGLELAETTANKERSK